MTIPDPKANYKDRVRVLTTGTPEGVVKSLEYACDFGTFSWRYYVRCKSKGNTSYTRVVGDDQIILLKEANWPFGGREDE